MRLISCLIFVTIIIPALSQNDYGQRQRRVENEIHSFLIARFGEDFEMMSHIQNHLREKNFYELATANWIGKGEIERQVQEDYIKKYAPLLTNTRADEEYKRVTQEISKRFPEADLAWLSVYEQALRNEKRIEIVCGLFCSKQRLVGITDKLIESNINGMTQQSQNVQSAAGGSSLNHNPITTAVPYTNGKAGNVGRVNSGNQGGHQYQPLKWCSAGNAWVRCTEAQYQSQNNASLEHKPATPSTTRRPYPSRATTKSTTRYPDHRTSSTTQHSTTTPLESTGKPGVDPEFVKSHNEKNFSKLLIDLRSWYPKIDFIHEKLFEDLKSRQIQGQLFFNRPVTSKEIFEKAVVPILNEPKYSEDVRHQVKVEAKKILERHCPELSNHHQHIIETFAQRKNDQFDASLMFTPGKLEQKMQQEIDEIKTQQTAYDKLVKNLESWFPHSKNFTDGFVQYLRSKNPSSDELNAFENRAVLLSSTNRYFHDFTQENPELHKKAIENQIKAVLDSIDREKATRNFEILQKRNPEVFQHLTDSATLETSVKQTMQPIQNCMAALPAKIQNILTITDKSDDEKADLETHFKSNHCFTDEICVKTNGNQSKADLELQLYIDAYRKSRTDSLVGNINIKDEIDESVYDIVETTIQTKGTVDQALAECFVLYLRRTNDLDQIYSMNLLFDGNLLLSNIKPFVERYELDYLRSLDI